ncbi:MAG: hypothetical protein ACRENT_00230 [Thermodesulfobacteriota bacterium]
MTICAICKEEVDSLGLIAERWVLDFIKKQHPEWTEKDGACPKCIEYYEDLDDMVSIVKEDSSE